MEWLILVEEVAEQKCFVTAASEIETAVSLSQSASKVVLLCHRSFESLQRKTSSADRVGAGKLCRKRWCSCVLFKRERIYDNISSTYFKRGH